MRNKKIEIEYMPNGETRGRLKISNRLVFSYTSTQNEHGWQNAHYHKHAKETYFILRGKIIIVVKEDGKFKYKELQPGNRMTIPKKIEHNVYVGKNTLFYVSKKSKKDLENDWFSADKLDVFTKEC